jgi:hypothetical protein
METIKNLIILSTVVVVLTITAAVVKVVATHNLKKAKTEKTK